MSLADTYRAKAEELNAKACTQTDELTQRAWAMLAQGYTRLAEQADGNSQSDVVYESAWSTPREDEPT